MNSQDVVVFAVVTFGMGIGFLISGIFMAINKRMPITHHVQGFEMREGASAQRLAVMMIAGGLCQLIATLLTFSDLKWAIFLSSIGGVLSMMVLGLSMRRRFE
ncbi:MAG: hypothetical protein KF716_23530 [Anaerolineae bacterium]|nr:hypothetical protein [Anaerolineae bacterium]